MSILEKKPQITNKIIRKEIDAKTLLIDSEKPSWVTVSKSMADLLCKLDGNITIEEIVKDTNNKVKKDVSQKLISGFEKLYKLGFLDNDVNCVINQSKSLDQVYFNLTKKCNLRCAYCYAKADMTNKLQEMPLKFWNDVVLQLKQLNPKASVCFTGG
jgi:sulfatase maturation enzyme AslB (radical SAM superfamily)